MMIDGETAIRPGGGREPGPSESAFARIVAALGLSYMAEPDRRFSFGGEQEGATSVRYGWVMLTNPASCKRDKKVSVLFEGNVHSCSLGDELTLSMIGRPLRAYAEGYIAERPLDRVFADALEVLMSGVRVKVSKRRTVPLPKATSAEEFMFRLAAAGYNIR